MAAMIKVKNIHKQNYLAAHGVFPKYEEEEAAFYKKTPQLLSLLESYTIHYICIPNKK